MGNDLLNDLQDWLHEELSLKETSDFFVDKADYPSDWTEAMKLKFEWAVIFARLAHKGVVRKGTTVPYVLHPVEASLIVLSMTSDLDCAIAAVLHDIVEDTAFSADDVKLLFGERIAKLVCAESEDKREDKPAEETWLERKKEALARLKGEERDAKLVCLGDKLSNMRMSVKTYREKGEAMWESFNQKDASLQAWYYYTIADALSELKAEACWQEYVRACDFVFAAHKDKKI